MVATIATEKLWDWLDEVPDPEIPVISVVDLGIVRELLWAGDDELVVKVTPTYSGCPATAVIAHDIAAALRAHGLERVRVEIQLAPAWTTDWISPKGREALRAFGIAPPGAGSPDGLVQIAPMCPRCASGHTECISQFGSTPCKALYRCLDCREPFDYFKPLE